MAERFLLWIRLPFVRDEQLKLFLRLMRLLLVDGVQIVRHVDEIVIALLLLRLCDELLVAILRAHLSAHLT